MTDEATDTRENPKREARRRLGLSTREWLLVAWFLAFFAFFVSTVWHDAVGGLSFLEVLARPGLLLAIALGGLAQFLSLEHLEIFVIGWGIIWLVSRSIHDK